MVYPLNDLENLNDDLVPIGEPRDFDGMEVYEHVVYITIQPEAGLVKRATVAYNSENALEDMMTMLEMHWKEDEEIKVHEMFLVNAEIGVVRGSNTPTVPLISEVSGNEGKLVLTPTDGIAKVQRPEQPEKAFNPMTEKMKQEQEAQKAAKAAAELLEEQTRRSMRDQVQGYLRNRSKSANKIRYDSVERFDADGEPLEQFPGEKDAHWWKGREDEER